MTGIDARLFAPTEEYSLDTNITHVEVLPTEVLRAPVGKTSSKLSVFLRDVVTLSGGTLLTSVLSIVLLFLVPRVVSVEDFGYWRLFLLYSVYVGLFHLGLADGALLRWAGKPLTAFQHEIVPLLRFLCLQHAVVAVPLGIAASVLLHSEVRFVVIGVLVFALIANLIILIQCALQSARTFFPVAVSTAGPLSIFVLLLCLYELKKVPNFKILIVLYCIGSAATLGYLLACVLPQARRYSTDRAWYLGSGCVVSGWSVLLANTGFNLVQAADRLIVSWTASIQDFGRYSLAASATTTVVLATVVSTYRVFFPHLAAIAHEERKGVYASASRLLFLTWLLLLPYYFVLDTLIRSLLPKYVSCLPVAFILLPGTIFLAEILVLQTSFAYINQRQRVFLLYTIGALIVGFSLEAAIAVSSHSLELVAGGQVMTLALWWFVNECNLRELTGRGPKQWGAAIGLFCCAIASYYIAYRGAHSLFVRIGIYYLFAGLAAWFGLRTEVYAMTRRVATVLRLGANAGQWAQ